MTNKSWKSVGIGSILLVLLTLAAYLPALRGGFIWDDDDHLTENPAMTAPDGLRQIWTSLAVSRYYPLTLTSFWVQRRLWGLNPLPYHAVNIALHAANAMLVFLLLRRLRMPGAWLAAALWALHPVNVETVAWVTELKNAQSGFFFFLASICFLRFDERPSGGRYALTLLCGAAAMLSKPSTVVLPAVLLLVVWWQHGRWQWRDWLRTAPLFAFALGMSALTILEQLKEIGGAGTQEALTRWDRLLLAGRVVWFYLGKLFWPADLMFIYPRWKLASTSPVRWVPLITAGVVALTLWRLRRQTWAKVCLLGLGYYALLLLPVSGLFDIFFFQYSYVADHFQYLACIGPIALVASGAAAFCNQTGQPGGRLGAIAAAALLTTFAVCSWRHEHVFKDVESLWRDTLARNPEAWIAHNNLGVALYRAGRLSEAIAEHEAVLRIKPEDDEAHSNLGLALAAQGKLAEATAEYREALRINPEFAEVHNNLGSILAQQGKVEEAIAEYQAALRIKPHYAEAHSNLGLALAGQGKFAEATAEYQAALRINPDIAETHNNLGNILASKGKVAEAVAEYEESLRIKPDYAEPHYNLGIILANQGRTSEAIAQYREAVRLKPGWPAALSKLAWLLATDGNQNVRNAAEAVPLAERLCEITGYQQADALNVLAAAYAEAGRFSDAIRVGQRAIDVATVAGQSELAQQIQERLRLYQAGRPFHQATTP